MCSILHLSIKFHVSFNGSVIHITWCFCSSSKSTLIFAVLQNSKVFCISSSNFVISSLFTFFSRLFNYMEQQSPSKDLWNTVESSFCSKNGPFDSTLFSDYSYKDLVFHSIALRVPLDSLISFENHHVCWIHISLIHMTFHWKDPNILTISHCKISSSL